ncbi:MAG: Tim44-like domain-containing protein [Desulfobacterales bacterium]
MNRKRLLGICLIFLMVAFIFIQPAYAGPGGQIAKVLAKTFWGKMVLGLLTLILLPVGIYLYIKQKLAERRAYKDLKYMARHDPNFEWPRAKERILDCFYRVHSAWKQEDVSEACNYMTDWYWQNQQLVYLDRLHREGLRNVCAVQKIRVIRPLLFIYRNDDVAHEGSVLVVSITANMMDCLVRRETDTLVEGDRKFRDHETIWTFALVEGQWRVANIEEAGCEFDYIFQVKNVPRVEETITNLTNRIKFDGRQMGTGGIYIANSNDPF